MVITIDYHPSTRNPPAPCCLTTVSAVASGASRARTEIRRRRWAQSALMRSASNELRPKGDSSEEGDTAEPKICSKT